MPNTDLEQAKALLSQGICTCALCKADVWRTSSERGVKPLLSWLDSREVLREFSAADKVVGKAAAFLYVLLGVKQVYAPVMSRLARETLIKHGIKASYDTLTDAIRNRTDTGFCPMETAVRDIEDPSEALAAIRKKAAELSG